MDTFHLCSQGLYQICSMDMVSNFNTLAFNDSISSLVRLAKSALYHTRKLVTLV